MPCHGLTPDQLADAAAQAERANRMDLCTSCGTPYDGGPPAYTPESTVLPRFRDGQCPECRL